MENKDIEELYLTYNKALNVLKEKFQKLQKSTTSEVSPISYIKTRLKTEKSTKEKLEKKLKLEYTAKNIKENLFDIAGIRIVCPFLSDIDKIIEFINNDPDIEVITIKNYIKEPKENGYSSYHMQVLVNTIVDGKLVKVKAEIQIRTMAMDVIASIDHKLKYKKGTPFSKEQESTFAGIVGYVYMLDSLMDNFIIERRLANASQEKLIELKITDPNFKQLLNKHEIALDKIKSLLEYMKEEYKEQGLINPIEHIKERIKPDTSIINKLLKKQKVLTLENIENYITDVGAIKIVCSFLSDVEIIKEEIRELEKLNLIRIIETQDYIKEPKQCGYSSYHFVVEVPIEFNGKITFVKTEIQVRTIIMDFWAKIEHILCYKKEATPEIKEQLKGFASALKLIEPQIDELAKTIFKERDPGHRTRKKEIPKQVTN